MRYDVFYDVFWKTVNRNKVHMHLVGVVSVQAGRYQFDDALEAAWALLAAKGYPSESWSSNLPRTGFRSAGPLVRQSRIDLDDDLA